MNVTDCVFLKKSETASGSFVYDLWSKEYGRIRGFAKESRKNSSPLWTGAIIEAKIETKNGTNRVVSVRLEKNFNTESLDYPGVLRFLKTVAVLSKALPEGTPNARLFESYREALPFFEKPETSKTAAAAYLTELSKTLGTYSPETFGEETLKRFSAACSKYPITEIVRIQGLHDELLDRALFECERSLAKYLS